MRLFTARDMTRRKNYRSDRMSQLRSEILSDLQDYESARTPRLRQAYMDSVQKLLRKYNYYGDR